jgi:hypothetical protein
MGSPVLGCKHVRHDLSRLSGAKVQKSWRTPLEKASGDAFGWLQAIADSAVAEVVRQFIFANNRIKNNASDQAIADSLESGEIDYTVEETGTERTAGRADRRACAGADAHDARVRDQSADFRSSAGRCSQAGTGR